MKSFDEATLTLADIFKFSPLLGKLSKDKHKVIQDIKNCRTIVLGGHAIRCKDCSFIKSCYNSCRNRHCPSCQYLARVKWIEAREKDLLPCPYFHVVFTIPADLRSLILINKSISYDILFKTASQTIKKVAKTHHGIDIGCIGILHTWAQNLIDHPHIHFLVPSGGLNEEKTKWVKGTEKYFLPVEALADTFRGKILDYFEKAFYQGKLKFIGKISYLSHPANFKELLLVCSQKKFNIEIRKPFAGPSQVLKYLGQYTHRIAISNYRLLKIEDGKVFFKVRDNDNPGRSKIMSLTLKEFMRRFLLHVLPRGYVRIRHFGLLGNRYKKITIALIHKIQNIKVVLKANVEESWQEVVKRVTGIDVYVCPRCKSRSLTIVKPIKSMINSS